MVCWFQYCMDETVTVTTSTLGGRLRQLSVGRLDQRNEVELRGPDDGYEEMQCAFSSAHLGP